MNIYKSIKKQLKFCIKAMDTSSSLFVVNPEKDFTRKRKHLFGDTLMNVILLESGSLKDEFSRLPISRELDGRIIRHTSHRLGMLGPASPLDKKQKSGI